MRDLKEFFREVGEKTDAELDGLIPATGKGPQSLRDAIRWSLLGGGKRFRPALVMAVGRAFGANDEKLLRTACAVEMIHTYSLIHDDLPSMDDDDMRRGRAACHIKFGEAAAILAGDALQALAFQTIAEDKRLTADIRIQLLSGLGKAAARMVIGQHMDLESEGIPATIADVEGIHKNKTGALILFSARAGAVIGGASEDELAAVSAYGEGIGLLFQIVDDLLDITASSEILGKTAGKDKCAAKATYPSVTGIDAARKKAEEAYLETAKISAQFNSDILTAIPKYLLLRNF